MQTAMQSDLFTAKGELENGDFTCVVCKGAELRTATSRGVKPLLDWLDAGVDLSGASAADRVVGNGAAYLYVLLGVRAVYAKVLSSSAAQTLTRHGIVYEYGELVESIRNRRGDGTCPIESAVSGESDPVGALEKIRAKLADLQKK